MADVEKIYDDLIIINVYFRVKLEKSTKCFKHG